MATLLASARLPLTPTVANVYRPSPNLDDTLTDDLSTPYADHHHSYLHSLIGAPTRKRKQSLSNGTVFCVSLPESIALPRSGRGYRSLSEPLEKPAMAVVMEEACGPTDVPSSPPELSYSKSSKSSESSLHSDDDDLSESAFAEKSPHFEELALEEDVERDSVDDSNLPPASRPTLRRPPPKSHSVGDLNQAAHQMNYRKSQSPPLRPMPNGIPRRYPTLHGAMDGVLRDQSLNLPNGRSFHRAAGSPTAPYTRQGPQRIASRSPSPSKPMSADGITHSPQLMASTTPKGSLDGPPSLGAYGRRSSWQPGQRKSVKELEAEYNDEDEEVPEEAILENVPISPLPGQPSFFRSASMTSSLSSGLRSGTPSPQRKPSYANLHSANIPKNAKRPSGPPMLSHGQYPSPRSPKHGRPTLPHSATVGTFPPEPMGPRFGPKFRSKSWTEDLNDEARQLSQALEEYAEKISADNPQSGTNSAASSPPRSSLSKKTPQTTVTELPSVPPVQKGNIMIDPLPISKEKEAVLTRTRPSWLPPKDPKEEKRHLKEFQRMMARAADAEKKRAQKTQEARDSQVEMKGDVARTWDQHVLPNWNTVIKEPGTRELWWRGVTPRSRGEVWQKAIGNDLGLTAASFDAALSRAQALEEKCAEMPPEERATSKEAAWLDAIARDVPAVFPELRMFQPEAPLHAALTDVLRAYTMYRSDVGYVYGTHLVAGIVCLLLRPPEAFVVLANLLNRPLPLAFLVHDEVAMRHTYDLVLGALKYKFTKLHDHLTAPSIDLKPEEYLDPMFRCLFAYNLPHEFVSRIWDIWAFEGDKALIRAAVAVLGRLESRLYGSRQEILGLVGWRGEARWDVGGEDDFIMAVKEAGKVDSRDGQRA